MMLISALPRLDRCAWSPSCSARGSFAHGISALVFGGHPYATRESQADRTQELSFTGSAARSGVLYRYSRNGVQDTL